MTLVTQNNIPLIVIQYTKAILFQMLYLFHYSKYQLIQIEYIMFD